MNLPARRVRKIVDEAAPFLPYNVRRIASFAHRIIRFDNEEDAGGLVRIHTVDHLAACSRTTKGSAGERDLAARGWRGDDDWTPVGVTSTYALEGPNIW